MAKATKKTRPGFEPAKGFPDPENPPEVVGRYTHFPHSNGAVCNTRPVPTNAGDYDPVNPTCPWCAKWLASAKAVTRARYPWSQEQAQAEATSSSSSSDEG